MPKTKALVLLSGGIDSATCAHFLKSEGYAVQAVFIDYGQAAVKMEQRASEALALHLEIPLTIYHVTGHNKFTTGELIGRNAFLIFSALFLSKLSSGLIAIGIHSGTPYYDCSPLFFVSMKRLIGEHSDGMINLVAPFLDWSKREIFDCFRSAELPLNMTYSCEAGKEESCGKCNSCRDRNALDAG